MTEKLKFNFDNGYLFIEDNFSNNKELNKFFFGLEEKISDLYVDCYKNVQWLIEEISMYIESEEEIRSRGIPIGYEDYTRINSLKEELVLLENQVGNSFKNTDLYQIIISYLELEQGMMEWMNEDDEPKIPPDFIRVGSIVYYKDKKYNVESTDLVEQEAYLKLISDKKVKKDYFTTLNFKFLHQFPDDEAKQLTKEIKLLENKLEAKKAKLAKLNGIKNGA